MNGNLQRWTRHLIEIKGCKSVAELVRKYGEPPHKVPEDGFEIWHYPLGVASGTLYSIHVSVWPDRPFQAYMYMEPVSIPDTPQPAWWRFWKIWGL